MNEAIKKARPEAYQKTQQDNSTEYTERQLLVLKALPYGERVPRYMLRMKTGLTDMALRKTIRELRLKGEWILSDDSGAGYWRSNDPKEFNEFKAWYTSYAKEIFNITARMEGR